MFAILLKVAAMTIGALLAQDAPTIPVPAEPTQPVAPARPNGPVQVDGGTTLSADATVEQVLEALHRRGVGLEDFSADVTLEEKDTALGDTTMRTGTAVYQRKGEGDARLHVVFDTRSQGNKVRNQKVEYLLDNGWLVDRDYERRKEVRRQILRPGEKIDLLKLGEGPFPLPVGQPKESVEKLFAVTKVPADAKDDPEGSVHVKLTPRPETQFARKFHAIDVWVDTTTAMPQRIQTVDVNQATQRRTELKIKALNQGLKDAHFTLAPIDERWDRHSEEYTD